MCFFFDGFHLHFLFNKSYPYSCFHFVYSDLVHYVQAIYIVYDMKCITG